MPMRHFRIALLASAVVMAASPDLAAAQSCRTIAGNLIQNCSFENPQPTGNGVVYPFAPVDSWMSTGNGSSGTFERWTFFDGFQARDGNSHLELAVNSSTSIYQTLNTVAGRTYNLGFSAANRPGAGYSMINVYLNGSFFMSTGQISQTYQWFDFNNSFVANSPTTTVLFESAGNGGSYGDHIDNVSVESATVPEPATYALVAAGLGAIAVVARKRRKKS